MGAMQPMGFTQEGSLYYGLSAGLEDVYVASLDPATGKLLAPPAKVSHRFEGFNSAPAWSPDGKYLAYRSKRWPVPTSAAGLANSVLVIRSVETGEERVFSAEGAVLLRMRWSPDGCSILCEATENREFHFTLIDARTGDVTFILQREDKGRITDYEWRPDGKGIFCIKGPEYSESIVMHDLETGKEKELWQDPQGVHSVGLGISPDGRQLVFGKDWKTLMVIAVEGGESRILHRLQEGRFAFPCSPRWTADGRYILFGKRHPNELWRVPVEGGEAQKLLETEGPLRQISVHPDGQRIAFTGGWYGTSEVWVMENFLPGFTAAR
jgi:Tol biopolymer transport system component